MQKDAYGYKMLFVNKSFSNYLTNRCNGTEPDFNWMRSSSFHLNGGEDSSKTFCGERQSCCNAMHKSKKKKKNQCPNKTEEITLSPGSVRS